MQYRHVYIISVRTTAGKHYLFRSFPAAYISVWFGILCVKQENSENYNDIEVPFGFFMNTSL